MNIQPNTDLGIFASLPRVNLAPLLVGGTQVLANPSRGEPRHPLAATHSAGVQAQYRVQVTVYRPS